MYPVQIIKDYFEKQAFGVCTRIGEKLHMQSSVIRLFFIYASFLTVGSPLIVYMILAFWMIGSAQQAQAQLAAAEAKPGVLGCIHVTPSVMEAHEKNSARCPASIIKGCGSRGGPGYRDARGCVGFKDIIRRCGNAPHTGDRCRAVAARSRLPGREG